MAARGRRTYQGTASGTQPRARIFLAGAKNAVQLFAKSVKLPAQSRRERQSISLRALREFGCVPIIPKICPNKCSGMPRDTSARLSQGSDSLAFIDFPLEYNIGAHICDAGPGARRPGHCWLRASQRHVASPRGRSGAAARASSHSACTVPSLRTAVRHRTTARSAGRIRRREIGRASCRERV